MIPTLQKAFPDAEIKWHENLASFLGDIEVRQEADLIITEDHMALVSISEDVEGECAALRKKYPEIPESDWNRRVFLPTLMRCLERLSFSAPVLVYSHSQLEWIDEDVLKSPRVSYLEKEFEFSGLIANVRRLIGPKT